MDTHHRRHWKRLTISIAAVMLGLILAAPAWAVPTEPTLSIGELQSLLDASGGSLEGHFKTVLKGSDIVKIDARVTAVTSGSQIGPDALSALILFESDDPGLTKIGGIASGMSGSPLYVDDDGTDKLVGAVSYGDVFTVNGMGLATPIEALAAIEDYTPVAAAQVRQLDSIELTAAGLKDRVIVTSDPENHITEAADGAIVMSPLASLRIGGIRPGSKIYKRYSDYLGKNGVSLVEPPAALQGATSMESTYSAPFEGGSAIAAMAARGGLWIGGVGTVTYEADGAVLAFGHPLYWSGESDLFMCNAWIDGTWNNSLMPYKLARPAAQRGTITEDRSAGIMGVDGPAPVEVPITAKATRNGKTAESTTAVSSGVINSDASYYKGIPTLAAYVAGSRLYDQAIAKGSSFTKTTIVVKSGADEYTVERNNVFDSPDDIATAVVADVDEIVGTFQEVGANGIAKPQIASVRVESKLSDARNFAEITGVNVAGGLKRGVNNVVVTYAKQGSPTDFTVQVPLTIPAGVPLSGALSAYSIDGPDSESDDGDDGDELFDYADAGSRIDRRTVKEVVDELKKAPTNDLLTVSFQPMDAVSGDLDEEPPPLTTYEPVTATKQLGTYVVGSVAKDAPLIDAALLASGKLPYNGSARINGEIIGGSATGKITVTRQYAGDPAPVLVKTVSITSRTGMFSVTVSGLKKNATIRLAYSGDENTLPVAKTLNVKVSPKVSLKTSSKKIKKGKSITLTAKVSPADTGGKVVFERYSRGKWRTIATKSVPKSGTAVYKYKAPLGKYKIRVRTTGSVKNASGKSAKLTIRVVR